MECFGIRGSRHTGYCRSVLDTEAIGHGVSLERFRTRGRRFEQHRQNNNNNVDDDDNDNGNGYSSLSGTEDRPEPAVWFFHSTEKT